MSDALPATQSTLSKLFTVYDTQWILCSGNWMGDIGARMLSKALHINKKLQVIHWDHNGTSAYSFYDIATTLEK